MSYNIYTNRTDGQSICIDCTYYRGLYLGCVIKNNRSTSSHVQTCDSYVGKFKMYMNQWSSDNWGELSGNSPDKPDVYKEIKEERVRQDAKYGKDRDISMASWLELIYIELQEALTGEDEGTPPPHDTRTELKQVAALCVAAMESYDRQTMEIEPC